MTRPDQSRTGAPTAAADGAAPRYDPTVPLAQALGVKALDGADQWAAQGQPVALGRVGAKFASRDLHKFKMLLGASIGVAGSDLFRRLHALLDAGLGDMASADALAWQCALLHVPAPASQNEADLVLRWERFTNHGWLAHAAGFSIEEVEAAGAAPGDDAVRMMLALRGGRWRTALPKVRTAERLLAPQDF